MELTLPYTDYPIHNPQGSPAYVVHSPSKYYQSSKSKGVVVFLTWSVTNRRVKSREPLAPDNLSVQGLEFCKREGIVVLTLPSHTSNKLQPLDRCVFGQFNNFFSSAVLDELQPKRKLDIYALAKLIVPFERDFLTSAVSDHPFPKGNEDTPGHGTEAAKKSSSTPGPSSVAIAGTSSAAIGAVSPKDLRPIPKATPRLQLNRGRCMIATDTPEKMELENKRGGSIVKRKVFMMLSSSSSEDNIESLCEESGYKTLRSFSRVLTGKDVSTADVEEELTSSDYVWIKFASITSLEVERRVLKGGVSSGLNTHMDIFEPCLFRVKGRRSPVTTQLTDISWDHFNSGDVFVLCTRDAVFLWVGRMANPLEKLQATKVAMKLQDEYNINSIVFVDDGFEHRLPATEKLVFNQHLNLKKRLVKTADEGNVDLEIDKAALTLYHCSDEEGTYKVIEVKSGPLYQSDLSSEVRLESFNTRIAAESGKPFKENPISAPDRDRTHVFSSLVQHETSVLDDGATKTGELNHSPMQHNFCFTVWRLASICALAVCLNSFIIDNGVTGIWVWVGRRASPKERVEAMRNAHGFVTKKGYPNNTPVTRVVDGGEPVEFKILFTSWRERSLMSTIQPKANSARLSMSIHTRLDAGTLHEHPQIAAASQLVDNGSGDAEVWRVEDSALVQVPRKIYGVFFTEDCYVVHYKYLTGTIERHIVYYWLRVTDQEIVLQAHAQGRTDAAETIKRDGGSGSGVRGHPHPRGYVSLNCAVEELDYGDDSTEENQDIAVMKSSALDAELGGVATIGRVVQGKEPPHFLTVFSGCMIILQGSSTDITGIPESFLLQVQGNQTHNTRAIQVERRAASLNTNYVFVLKTLRFGNFLWSGKGSTGDEREMAKKIASTVVRGDYEVLYEGQEKCNFWEAIGGKGEYTTNKEQTEHRDVIPPRLFHSSCTTDTFRVEEIVNFSQSDLLQEDTMLLDARHVIYIWSGKASSKTERDAITFIPIQYLRTDPAERDEDIPVFFVKQGFEPNTFTGFFKNWNSTFWNECKSYDELRRELEGKNPVLELDSVLVDGERRFDDFVKYPVEMLREEADTLPEDIDKTRRELESGVIPGDGDDDDDDDDDGVVQRRKRCSDIIVLHEPLLFPEKSRDKKCDEDDDDFKTVAPSIIELASIPPKQVLDGMQVSTLISAVAVQLCGTIFLSLSLSLRDCRARALGSNNSRMQSDDGVLFVTYLNIVTQCDTRSALPTEQVWLDNDDQQGTYQDCNESRYLNTIKQDKRNEYKKLSREEKIFLRIQKKVLKKELDLKESEADYRLEIHEMQKSVLEAKKKASEAKLEYYRMKIEGLKIEKHLKLDQISTPLVEVSQCKTV
uniref:Gelsolin-like domain-containing protein n=2 Tax=Timema TaxID=61471 RepID=A0A7R9EFA1_9NEOP|nr:unnamed protein product [Timema monikensis]